MIRGLINVISQKASHRNLRPKSINKITSAGNPSRVRDAFPSFTVFSPSEYHPQSLLRVPFSQRAKARRDICKTHARINPSRASEMVASAERQILARRWSPGTFLRGPSAKAEVPLSHPRTKTSAQVHPDTAFKGALQRASTWFHNTHLIHSFDLPTSRSIEA